MGPWLRLGLRTALKVLGVGFAMGVIWIGMSVYAQLFAPASDRAYAETWRGAPIGQLIALQGAGMSPPADANEGVVRYHFNGWRGMKGRAYPGNFIAVISGDAAMQSHVWNTAAASAYCEITFYPDAHGLIERIDYVGNDCD